MDIWKNLFGGQDKQNQSSDEGAKISTDDIRKAWMKQAYENQSRGISCKDTIKECEIEFDGMEINLTTDYDRKISEADQSKSRLEAQLSKLTDHYDKHHKEEKDHTPEDEHARLDHLQAQIVELENAIKEKELCLKKLNVDIL